MMSNELTTAPSGVATVAHRLVELCNQGRNLDCYDLFYAEDCVSVEAFPLHPGAGTESVGLSAIRQKVAMWSAMATMKDASMTGPFFHGPDRFGVFATAEMEFTDGPMAGRRMRIDEVGIYTVRDGKIVREEFYAAQP